MSDVDNWGMDLFKLSSVTNGRPLTALTYTIFKVFIPHDKRLGAEGLKCRTFKGTEEQKSVDVEWMALDYCVVEHTSLALILML